MSTALVLAGGGLTGIAWELGVLKGLRNIGIEPFSHADLVVGTSAGSTVGAQLCLGHDLDDLYERQLVADTNEISPRIDLELLAQVYAHMEGGGTTTDEQRQAIGRLALAAKTADWPTRRAVIRGRIGTQTWPDRDLVITTVDAHSGEFRTWTKSDGVGLVDAVASSCAVATVWPCVPINGRMYYDGGFRNSVNAFLARGFDTVWVIAPLTAGVTSVISNELDALRKHGSTVHTIIADDQAVAAMGPNSLDPRMRGPAAEHGLRQGRGWA